MRMKTCEWLINGSAPCGNLCEGKNALCATHAREAKIVTDAEKEAVKRDKALQKAKIKGSQPRPKGISKNPKDWGNTFLCSDGTKVTQAEIKDFLKKSYQEWESNGNRSTCNGCGGKKTCHAHIIPQARCKQIGKTELIWQFVNYFDSCFACNLAIENPKCKDWKNLKNINRCLEFIKVEDPELYMKFELSAIDQTKETT